jgi:adenylylsulfate kinase-like enzyme
MIIHKIDFNPKPAVIWLTGLSGAGKTTIANCLIERFKELSVIPVLLDGDEIRKTLRVNNFDIYLRISVKFL